MGVRAVLLCVLASVAAGQDRGQDQNQAQALLLEGRVTSAEDGKPIAGATVLVRGWHDVVDSWRVDAEPATPLHTLATDAEGRFAVPAVEGEDGPVVTVRAPGHATVTWLAERRGAGPVPRNDVALPRAGTFQGTVRRPDGEPAAWARVFAVDVDALERDDHADDAAAAADLLWGSGQYDDAIAFRFVEAGADAEGRYTLDDADPARRYVVVAAAAGTGPAVHPGVVEPGTTAPRRVDLLLPAPVTVTVRVATTAGEPLRVAKGALRASPVPTSWTEAEPGVYVLGPVGPGDHILEMQPEGRSEVRHAFRVPRGTETHAVEVRLGAGLAVAGVVVDLEGAPVIGARVSMLVWHADVGESRVSETYTDEHGRFQSWGHPPDKTFVYVTKDGYQKARFEFDAPKSAFTVRLRPARMAWVRVAPPEGRPRGPWVYWAARAEGGEWSRAEASWEPRTLLQGVPLGRTTLRLWAPGCALWEREIDMAAGDGDPDLGAVRLEPARTVTVRVVDEAGRPVAGVKVHARVVDLPPVDWTKTVRTTGSDGKAVLEVHAPGPPLAIYIEEGAGRARVSRTIEMPGDPGTVVDVPAGARQP